MQSRSDLSWGSMNEPVNHASTKNLKGPRCANNDIKCTVWLHLHFKERVIFGDTQRICRHPGVQINSGDLFIRIFVLLTTGQAFYQSLLGFCEDSTASLRLPRELSPLCSWCDGGFPNLLWRWEKDMVCNFQENDKFAIKDLKIDRIGIQHDHSRPQGRCATKRYCFEHLLHVATGLG